MIEAVDSYYTYVAAQMATLRGHNSSGLGFVTINGVVTPQPMCGYVESRDWPMTPNVEGGLYLLLLGEQPTPEKSQAQTEYCYHCQWMWLLIGQDIQAAQLAQNRGDRFRQNMVIEENLRQANYPGYCQKNRISFDSQGNPTIAAVTSLYPVSQPEMVRWTKPRFMPRNDNQKSGLLYGAAAVELYAYSDVALAVA